MRPVIRFLDDKLVERIICEAIDILGRIGVTIHNENILTMLSEHDVKVDSSTKRVYLTEEIIRKALTTAPSSFELYDVLGNRTHDF